jgi:hypothetical protein
MRRIYSHSYHVHGYFAENLSINLNIVRNYEEDVGYSVQQIVNSINREVVSYTVRGLDQVSEGPRGTRECVITSIASGDIAIVDRDKLWKVETNMPDICCVVAADFLNN